MRYQFLKKHQKEYNIQKACKILRISRSGYYAYLHRRKSKRIIENEALTEIIKDIFHEHQGRYGARRIRQVLLQKNIHVNQKRVSRLMSERGIIPKGAKKKYRYYPNKTQYEERENILGQIFSAKQKNQIWVDIFSEKLPVGQWILGLRTSWLCRRSIRQLAESVRQRA